jgi:uncharacterized RDD family membrane protein YckC
MSSLPEIDGSTSSTEPIAGPWSRYGARLTDMMLVAIALSLADELFGRSVSRLTETAQGFVVGLLWVPIESALLATLGATPGKALYGLRVLTPSKERLAFGKASHRSLLVFMLGLGIGVRALTGIALLINYWKLSKSGATPWDQAVDSVEHQTPIRVLRLVTAVTVTFGLAYIVIEGRLEGLKPLRPGSQPTQAAFAVVPRTGVN